MSQERLSPYEAVEARLAMISKLKRLEGEGKNVTATTARIEEEMFQAVDDKIDEDLARKSQDKRVFIKP